MTTPVRITRQVDLPDPLKVARSMAAPHLGPRILFFSGGSALKDISRELIHYTENSIHIITAFDSGGSSAVLRKAFDMISVGDLRNRMMALADQSVKGNPNIYKLFAYRLPKDEDQQTLRGMLQELIAAENPMTGVIRKPLQTLICNHLADFYNAMPEDFDLRGANIGNLILAGGTINNRYDIEPVLFLFEKLVEVRGIVKPIMQKNLHLIARLEDGTVLPGQHLLTGKEAPPIQSPVQRVWLSDNLQHPEPGTFPIENSIRKWIRKAELICYPVGSFYSSLIANLLPDGVTEALAQNPSPKIYIPNTGCDPEQIGMDPADSVRTLLQYLDPDKQYDTDRVLDFVLVDTTRGQYYEPVDIERIRKMGVEVIDTELISPASAPDVDPRLVVQTLISMC